MSRLRRIGRGLAARPTLAAALIYGVLALIMFSQALLPGNTMSGADFLWSDAPWQSLKPHGVRYLGSNPEVQDATTEYEVWNQYNAKQLPHISLWDPYIMGGRPYVGNYQSAVLSPFNAPSDVLPFWRSLGLVAALKLFIAALGTYLLARALAMRFAGALLAGLGFGFGLYMVTWVPFPMTSVWALLPWVLLATDRVVRRPDAVNVAVLALLVGVQFLGGHPESNFHALFGTAAFLVLRLAMVRRDAGSVPWRSAGLWVAGVAGGGLLAAALLLPFLELLSHSIDAKVRGQLGHSHVPSKYVFALLLPEYWGRATQTLVEGFTVVRAYYVGAITVMLALIALIIRPSLERISLVVFSAFVACMMFGIYPVFNAVTKLPGFSSAYNDRMQVLLVMCVALLGGWGLDELMKPEFRRRRAVIAAAVGLLLAPVAYMVVKGSSSFDVLGKALRVAWGFHDMPGGFFDPSVGPTIRLSALLVWLPLAGAAAALIVLRARGRLTATAFGTAAVVLLVLDLFRINMGQNPAIPVAHAQQPVTGSIRYLQARAPRRFAAVIPGKSVSPTAPMPPNLAMRYGIYDSRGYDYPVEERYYRFWHRHIMPFRFWVYGATLAQMNRRSLHDLGLIGVSDLIADPKGKRLRGPGLRLAYSGADARVYANDRALPRAVVVGRQRVVGGGAAALGAVTAPRFNGRREAVTEHAVKGVPAGGPGGSAGSARITTYKDDRVAIDAQARRPGMLVLNDVWYPGWKASVDGHDVPVERADYLFRGVPVPPGRHKIEFRYEPLSWRIGLLVTVLALLAAVGALALGLRRRRQTSTPSAE